MQNKLTDEQQNFMAIALGERTGMDVNPKDIKIIGKWLFHNDPDIDDVDVYELPLSMCAEAWDGCKLEASPFGTNDPETLQATITKLESWTLTSGLSSTQVRSVQRVTIQMDTWLSMLCQQTMLLPWQW